MRSHYCDDYSYHFMILLLVCVTTLFLLLWRRQRNGIRPRLPPGPRRIPLIGNLHQLGNDLPHISLQKLSNEYGSLMFLKLGSIPTLVVSSADMAKEILTIHDRVFSNRPIFYAPAKLSYGCSDITFSRYGDYWREVKKIAVLELLSAKKVLSCRAVREEEVALAINLIRTSSSSSVPVNLSEILLCLINNVVCIQLKTNWHMDEFYDKVIDEHISKSSKSGVEEDFVDVLLRVQKDPSQGITLTRDNIKGILM
ncbi:hypothetical protein MKX03_018475, partial [Papaver bracteatum]